MAFFAGLFFIIGLIVLFIFALGASLLSGIFRFVFGSKRRSSSDGASPFGGGTYRNKQGQQSQQTQSNQTSEDDTSNHHKVFSSNEGDYVDFEEVDEN